ncbi:MAG: tRNA (adenosine(37)-N6)-dimethylallyltransferase MiaA [Pontixanthobacter sp.]
MSIGNSPDTVLSGKPPLALIAGPTASGKSDLAVDLALALRAEGRDAAIVNCDSAQVYSDLQILSARPSPAEMRGIPHHLFGEWDGATACSTTEWAKAAKIRIAKCHAAGVVPILVGGTGLYIRTLLEGISPIPAIDPAIRADIRAMDQREARIALEGEDAEAAARLAPADVTRTARALEVVRSTGKPMAYYFGKKTGGISTDVDLHPLLLIPEREALYDRCNARFIRMLECGAEAEVARLMERNLDPQLPIMRAIGVREIAAANEGVVEREAMIEAGQMATRQYAKRQFTWFRNQLPMSWARKKPSEMSLTEEFETLLLK